LGGLAAMLAAIVKERTGAKVRGIELSLLQRCGAHLASETDIEESFMSGKAAVENAVAGISGKMVGFARGERDGHYLCKTQLLNLTDVANAEKKVPREWINEKGNGVEQAFVDYVLPLIQGEPNLPKRDSLPRFAKLKKVLAKAE
jgi:6-phosphofructokinase 1